MIETILIIYLTGCLLMLGFVAGNNFENTDIKSKLSISDAIVAIMLSWYGFGAAVAIFIKEQSETKNHD